MITKIRPIRIEVDYEQVLALVSPMFDSPPAPGMPEGEEFEVWITLILAYEQAVCPIGPLYPEVGHDSPSECRFEDPV